MEIKRTIKTDMVLKNAKLVAGNVVDDTGEIVDLNETIYKIYGEDVEFKLTLTRSTSEELDIEEINADDLAPDYEE